jgi:fibronectin-binding autotransporter adhesin
MKSSILTIVFFASGLLSCRADIINGTFETGDLSGWTIANSSNAFVTGPHTVLPPAFILPAGGVTTNPDAGNFQSVIRPGVFGQQFIEPELGLIFQSFGSVGSVGTIGAIYQDVNVLAGDRLSFRWSFTIAEQDNNYNDRGFFTVVGANTNSVFELANAGVGFVGVGQNPIVASTGYQLRTYDFNTAGTYRLGFGSLNAIDGEKSPALYLDNVSIAGNINPVPAPAGIYLVLAGLGMFGVLRKSFK